MTTRIDTRVEPRSIAGVWQCRLDEQDVGLRERWYVAPLDAGGDGNIELPGTTDLAGLGEPLALQPELTRKVLQGLHRTSRFVGPVWYQTDIELLPHEADGRTRWSIELERVIWESQAWLDHVPLGRQDSLSTAHHYDLPADLRPGKHRLTIRVDNRPACNLGIPHAYSEETQPTWNGLVGALQLKPSGSARFERVRVTPNVATRRFSITAEVVVSVAATLDVSVKSPDGLRTFSVTRAISASPAGPDDAKSAAVHLDIALGDDAVLWDEFNPALYDIHLSLRTADDSDASESDTRDLRVGLRSIETRGNALLVNGRPTFLRGTLECCIFPDTGHPPCEIGPWRRIMQIIKAYGLNHLRFHSYCPPDAAFEAADEAGVYFQVELPHWTTKAIDSASDTIRYLDAEGRRILDAYANHPSFILMSMGNELPGDWDAIDGLVTRLREHDNRPLFTSTTYSFTPRGQWPGPIDDVYITQQTRLGWTRGQGFFNNECPTTDRDFARSVAGCPTPVITHEVGQYSVYPDVDEIGRYRGALRPLNFEAIRHDLQKKGLLERSKRFTAASGRWSVELYREDIERALRTEGLSGIQLLDVHDFPGQGTALVGFLDAFWESKGLVEPDRFARFCAATSLLARLPKRVYETGETIDATIQLAHFGPEPIPAGTRIDWTLRDDHNVALTHGSLSTQRTIMPGERPIVGKVSASLDKVVAASRLRFELSMQDGQISNDWNLWCFPRESNASEPSNVLIVRELDENALAALQGGARVLFTPHASSIRNRIRGQFVPVFWSPMHFPMQPGTQGLLVDSKHPALADFPTEMHTDWQWWDLTRAATASAIQDIAPAATPIVQFVDHYGRNATPALVYEARVGQGRILVCTLDISGDLSSRPVARQLRQSLLRYAASEQFAPTVTWAADQLAAQFGRTSPMAGAKIIDVSSFQPGCEPTFAIDADPTSFWHNDWSAGAAYPHHLTIDLGAETALEGVRLLPRQDGQKSALIDAFHIELSRDGTSWERVADARFDGSNECVVPLNAHYEGTRLAARRARLLKIVATSGQDGTPHASLAEVSIIEAN